MFVKRILINIKGESVRRKEIVVVFLLIDSYAGKKFCTSFSK